MMPRAVDIEALRRSFLTVGQPLPAPRDAVRPEVFASWERSLRHGVDPDRISARFLGHHRELPLVVARGEDVFDGFRALNDDCAASLALLDDSGVVRVRRDADPALARLLDGVLLVPGYGYSERAVGTTAASIALHERTGYAISGPEHYHAQLMFLGEAAAPVTDPRTGDPCGAVVVITHQSAEGTMGLPLARLLARQVADRLADEPQRRSRAVLARFHACAEQAPGAWVLATDGDTVLTNAAARQVDAADQRALGDLLLAGLVLEDFADKRVDLPSGARAEVAAERVTLAGRLVGCVLVGSPADAPALAAVPEAVRRQGAHVAPIARRDYARGLRASPTAQQLHAAARIRANQELLTPFLRARHEVVANIKQGRNHLLIGEPGVGKRQLVLGQFRQAFPRGRVVTVDCASFAAESGAARAERIAFAESDDDRPHLVLLGGLNALTPVGARRLDEFLRPLVALPAPPRVVGCVDTPAVDATRPYGLLLRHFHEITRVPALRHRLDEIGELALSILRRMSGRRSLRLSLQVVRVLEGYAWPGNISELEDVLRYVVARKPVGEIQPPDLPPLCFQGRMRKLSMLEAAQCDAIIQALYESRGNRYKAAAMLGIARSSLYRKIDAFGISYIA